MGTDQIETTCIETLVELAENFSQTLRPGELVGLSGPLGAGKTTFVKYVSKSLGVTEEIISPTFLYEQTYRLPMPFQGIIELRHLDLYRIADVADLDALGIQTVDPYSVALVEWIEHVPSFAERADVTLTFTMNDHQQRFVQVRRNT